MLRGKVLWAARTLSLYSLLDPVDHTTPANQLSSLPPEGLIGLTGPLPNYDSEENVLSLLYSEKHERKISSFEELQLFFVRNILTMVVTPIQKTESTQILAVVWKLNRNIFFFFNRRGPQHPVITAKGP